MADLVDSGKIRFIGVSNFSVRALQKAQAALPNHRIASNQLRYNLTERTIEFGMLDYCRRQGITILAFSPLAMGLPAIRAADPEGVLSQVAAAAGKTEAQVALNWVISHDGVIALSKGSTVARVQENCGAYGWRLPPDALNLLNTKIGFQRRTAIEAGLRRVVRFAFQTAGKDL
jgi:diketogulonate reductase-like aldo/keto reductase